MLEEIDAYNRFEDFNMGHLIFDPSVRLAQFWREEGKLEKAKKVLEDSLQDEDNYYQIFKVRCAYLLAEEQDEMLYNRDYNGFFQVLRGIKNFKQFRKVLNDCRQEFEIFPEDRYNFVALAMPMLKKELKRPLSLDFLQKTETLKNSLRISEYLKIKLKNHIRPHFETGDIGCKFSCNIGKTQESY